MTKYALNQKICIFRIDLSDSGKFFHHYTPTNDNLYAGRPEFMLLECVDPTENAFKAIKHLDTSGRYVEKLSSNSNISESDNVMHIAIFQNRNTRSTSLGVF